MTVRLTMLRCAMTRLLPCVAVSLSLAANCFAHDTWLSPSSYSADVGQTITFALTSGMEFPKLDAAIKPERVHQARFSVAGEKSELKEFKAGENALQFERAFAKPGIATVWLQLRPKDIELTDDDVAHYLEEIRAPQEIERAWAAQKGKQKWKELYTKCAKTFVAVGDAATDDSWREPVGLALELVPLQNPTTIRAGESAKFKLLHNAKPVRDAALALHSGGGKPTYVKTDAEGVATLQFDKAGPALITNVQLQPPQGGKPWESDFTTATFEVQPK